MGAVRKIGKETAREELKERVLARSGRCAILRRTVAFGDSLGVRAVVCGMMTGNQYRVAPPGKGEVAMDIVIQREAPEVRIALVGRLDVASAPLLQDFAVALSGPLESLVVDCSQLEYVSSAGLRALLIAHKRAMRDGAPLALEQVADPVREVLDMTGFSKVFDVRS